MDWGWTNAVSPIAVILLGWWMKRADEQRGRDQIAAAAAAKVAAEGAAALARENIRQAVETHQTLRNVESNVNGRLSRQSEIAEIAQTDAAAMRAELANLKVLVASALERKPEALEQMKEVVATPMPPPPDLPPPAHSIPAMQDPEKPPMKGPPK